LGVLPDLRLAGAKETSSVRRLSRDELLSMLKSLRRWLSALALFPLAICQGGSARKGTRWVVCYSDKARPEEFLAFDLAVLNSDNHPPLALLSRPARAMLAYLSLGEVGHR
jgi:hypothetical protein